MSMLQIIQYDKTLLEIFAAIRSTTVSNQLPSSSVLLQGRHLRSSLPFLSSALPPKGDTTFVIFSAVVAPTPKRGSPSECALHRCSFFFPGGRSAYEDSCKFLVAKGSSQKVVCGADFILGPVIGWPNISSNALGHLNQLIFVIFSGRVSSAFTVASSRTGSVVDQVAFFPRIVSSSSEFVQSTPVAVQLQ